MTPTLLAAPSRQVRSSTTGLLESVGAGLLTVAGAAAISHSPMLAVWCLGIALITLAPEITLLAVAAFVEEELVAGGHAPGGVSSLVSVGSTIYQTTFAGFRVVALVAIYAAAVAWMRRRPVLSPRLVWLLVAAIGWASVLAVSQGTAPTHAVSAATPWILLLSGYVVGASARSRHNLSVSLTRVLAIVIAAKSAIAVYVYLLGSTQTLGGVKIVYYDSMTPYLGGAAMLAAGYSHDRRSVRLLFGVCGAILVLTSLRRNVVLALVASLAILGTRRSSRRLVLRSAVFVAIAIVAASVFVPKLSRAGARSIDAAFLTTTGSGGDTSTQGHLSDLSVGRQIVAQHPLLGIGVYASAQPGLVVSESQNLYIHDEYLQTWARYGLLGFLSLLALLATLMRASWRALARSPDAILPALTGILLLGFPASLIFFPQFSALARFDILLGILAGCLPEIRAHSPAQAGLVR